MPLISDEQLSFACNQSIILPVSGSDAPRNNESKMLGNRTRTKTSHSNYGCILSRMRLHFCLKVYQIPGCRRFGYAALRCRTRRILTCIRFSSNFLIYSSRHACTEMVFSVFVKVGRRIMALHPWMKRILGQKLNSIQWIPIWRLIAHSHVMSVSNKVIYVRKTTVAVFDSCLLQYYGLVFAVFEALPFGFELKYLVSWCN